MSDTAVLWLGFVLGLRHALDPDHVVAITALSRPGVGPRHAAWLAVSWGTGHALATCGVGVLVVHAEVRPPPAFELVTTLLVAAMLILLGLGRLLAPSAPPPRPTARPLLVGLVHGLAGSAAIALVAATTITSHVMAWVYLALFGLSTMVGMALLSLVMSSALRWTVRPANAQWVSAIAGWLSIAIGVFVLLDAAAAAYAG